MNRFVSIAGAIGGISIAIVTFVLVFARDQIAGAALSLTGGALG